MVTEVMPSPLESCSSRCSIDLRRRIPTEGFFQVEGRCFPSMNAINPNGYLYTPCLARFCTAIPPAPTLGRPLVSRYATGEIGPIRLLGAGGRGQLRCSIVHHSDGSTLMVQLESDSLADGEVEKELGFGDLKRDIFAEIGGDHASPL